MATAAIIAAPAAPAESPADKAPAEKKPASKGFGMKTAARRPGATNKPSATGQSSS